MSKPSSHRISWDDNSAVSSPPQTDTDAIDTVEDDEIDKYRRRSPGTDSPVTFYIESESSKVGKIDCCRKALMIIHQKSQFKKNINEGSF